MAIRWKTCEERGGVLELSAKPSIPSLNTVPQCKTFYSVTQHSTTVQNLLFRHSTQYHSAKPSIPSLNTVPQCKTFYSVTQHSTTVQNLLFHHSTQYHMETDGKFPRKGSASPYLRLNVEPSVPPIDTCTTWRSDGKLVRREAQCKTFYSITQHSTNSITQHSTTWKQMESLGETRWGLGLSMKPSVPPVSTVPNGGQMKSLRRKRSGGLNSRRNRYSSCPLRWSHFTTCERKVCSLCTTYTLFLTSCEMRHFVSIFQEKKTPIRAALGLPSLWRELTYLSTCGRQSLVSGTQHDIVVSWITLCK